MHSFIESNSTDTFIQPQKQSSAAKLLYEISGLKCWKKVPGTSAVDSCLIKAGDCQLIRLYPKDVFLRILIKFPGVVFQNTGYFCILHYFLQKCGYVKPSVHLLFLLAYFFFGKLIHGMENVFKFCNKCLRVLLQDTKRNKHIILVYKHSNKIVTTN